LTASVVAEETIPDCFDLTSVDEKVVEEAADESFTDSFYNSIDK
jgi:hypothetical protein